MKPIFWYFVSWPFSALLRPSTVQNQAKKMRKKRSAGRGHVNEEKRAGRSCCTEEQKKLALLCVCTPVALKISYGQVIDINVCLLLIREGM